MARSDTKSVWRPREDPVPRDPPSVFDMFGREGTPTGRGGGADPETRSSKRDRTVVAQVADADSESSGIVDVSQWFGQGAWLLTVQGHGRYVDQELIGDVTYKLSPANCW